MTSVKNYFGVFALFCLFCLGVFSTHGYADELVSTVDRSTISVDETLQLTVRYSGDQQRGTPDFSALERDFEIESTSQSNQIRSVNGRVDSHTQWTIQLLAKREGQLLIPSFNYAGQISDALQITVQPPKKLPEGTRKDVFIKMTIDKDKAYVQEQIIVTYQLYYSVNITGLEKEDFEVENTLIEPLPQNKYKRSIDGKTYGIVEFTYALFPQTSGPLEIPALRWDIKVSNSRSQSILGFSGRYEVKRERTQGKTIDIKPVPATFPAGNPWIPASNLTIGESWSKNSSLFKVGEPNNRTITLNAEGLMASQLPQVWGSSEFGSIKVYADQPSLENDPSNDGFVSTRIESAAIVISEPGDSELPAIRIPWWDTKTDTLKYAEIPAKQIKTLGSQGANRSSNSYSSPMPNEEFPTNSIASPELEAELSAIKSTIRFWQGLSLILFLIVLALAVILLFPRRKNITATAKPQTGEKLALKNLTQACKAGEPLAIRNSLLNWAGHYWTKTKVTTLGEIGEKIGDTALQQQLDSLDKGLYAPDSALKIDSNLILSSIKAYVNNNQEKDSSSTLSSFYPN